MSKNNKDAKLISMRTTGKSYGISFIFFGIIAFAILATGYWEGDVPPYREVAINPFVAVFVVICIFLLIYYNAGKTFKFMEQEIDKGMIVYVSMVLLLVFVFG
jgi:membrane protein YdbS with pleckstrin-like domain